MKQAIAALAAVSASVISYPGAAQPPDEPVDQIIVTGARAPLSINALGSAVTVFTRDEIERRQVRYVSDLLRTVPGFAVSQSGTQGAQTQVRVRGAEANHVLVLIDGARANDPASGDEFRWEFLSTANIERIEIVRGPQSAIWGSDALAGVVNIITRAGTPSAADAYVETGSMDTLNAALNGATGGDSWNLGFSVEHLSTDGSNIARTGTENDAADATTASLSASLQAGDALSLSFGARRVDALSHYDNIDYFTTGLPADSDVALDTLQHYAHIGLSIGANETRIRQHVYLRYFDSENRNLFAGSEDISTLADRLAVSYQSDISLGQDRLSLAVEHEATGFEQRGPIGFGDPNQVQDMDVTSVVIDYQGHVGESVTWLASARYDDNSVFDDATTGRLSIAWSLDSDTRLRANVGTGRKNPTFIEVYGYYPGQFTPAQLEPETSVSYEVGIEQQFGQGVNLQLTAFRQDLENEINGFVFDPVTFMATAANMEGNSRRAGAELALLWDMSQAVSLAASYTYVDSQADDVREVRRPRHSGSIDIDYGFLNDRAHLALTAAYGGTRADTYFPPWPDPPELVNLASHWLVDLTARYRWSESMTMFLRAANLLDTDYEHVYGFRTPGRAAYAGIKLDFGR
jgi:vitamin B12 transporter